MPRVTDSVLVTALEYYLGTDDGWAFTVYTDTTRTTCRDVSGMTFDFLVKRDPADVAGLFTASGTVGGTFNADPAVNTQVVTVLVADTDLPTSLAAGVCHWELKRTDAGAEQIIARGSFTLIKPLHD